MPASRGTFQNPRGKESPASRIQRHPEVQLNGATQQLAFLSRDFSKYLIAAQYLGLHTNTHTGWQDHTFFFHHNSYCLQTVKMRTHQHTFWYSWQKYSWTACKMFLKHNVGSNLRMHFRKHAKALQVALFQLEKLAHCFQNRHGGTVAALTLLLLLSLTAGLAWVLYGWNLNKRFPCRCAMCPRGLGFFSLWSRGTPWF